MPIRTHRGHFDAGPILRARSFLRFALPDVLAGIGFAVLLFLLGIA